MPLELKVSLIYISIFLLMYLSTRNYRSLKIEIWNFLKIILIVAFSDHSIDILKELKQVELYIQTILQSYLWVRKNKRSYLGTIYVNIYIYLSTR